MNFDMTSLYPYLNDAFITLGGALIYYISRKLAAFLTANSLNLSADTQAKIGKIIDAGLMKAVSFGYSVMTEQERKNPTISTNSQALQTMLAYANEHLGDTLTKAGKSDDQVVQMLMARWPILQGMVQGAAAHQSNVTVVTAPQTPAP